MHHTCLAGKASDDGDGVCMFFFFFGWGGALYTLYTDCLFCCQAGIACDDLFLLFLQGSKIMGHHGTILFPDLITLLKDDCIEVRCHSVCVICVCERKRIIELKIQNVQMMFRLMSQEVIIRHFKVPPIWLKRASLATLFAI